ncbi:MAG TPA: type II toxin-antitoxin system prevent-host-death family antitoxin [Terracidiphilus sp.]|jgi:prevent-host-death family protein|nr:type II toxin-antitoxin system prevent-host-death family antitoxin [Terracidiphilus sp.]
MATLTKSTQVNIFEAKTHLSRLIEQVEQGGEVIIARAGKPVARLTRLEPAEKKPIRYGLMKGEIWIADDFDDPLPDDLLAEFEGDIFPPEESPDSPNEQQSDARKER